MGPVFMSFNDFLRFLCKDVRCIFAVIVLWANESLDNFLHVIQFLISYIIDKSSIYYFWLWSISAHPHFKLTNVSCNDCVSKHQGFIFVFAIPSKQRPCYLESHNPIQSKIDDKNVCSMYICYIYKVCSSKILITFRKVWRTSMQSKVGMTCLYLRLNSFMNKYFLPRSVIFLIILMKIWILSVCFSILVVRRIFFLAINLN